METERQLQVSSNSRQHNGGTSFFKTCFNGLNALAGIGILSMPYAVSQGGWLSFMLLIIFAMICWYTALLLERCMNQQPLIKSYADIGEVAFGYKGRVVIASFIYVELFLIAVELLILEGDNLEKLFPNMSFTIIGVKIGSKSGFMLITALIILPTTWLRSLGALAYISVGGVVASVILIGCVVWVGEVDGVGFHERGKLVNLGGLTTAMSLFAFCYCAHALMPTICNSMNDRKQFSKVLLVCFVASTIIYGTVAILGYMMFGDHLKSQITLNLPTNKISTKIAIYTTIVNPFTKYAIVITPIINAIEEKWHLCKRRPVSILVRTSIVVSSVIVALFVPFFGYIMAFIGAFLSVAISLLFPCLCYLKMHKAARRFGLELIIIIAIMIIGTFIGIQGTYISLVKIVNNIRT
ncbi:putative amino acid transporter, transmembrane domain-containing protein [Medicago truncatula]|uniref:Putative amino acid transporter, transmembrane domain-containing protein n=1 Tax=Medicago truncatula TaxID=3880 RepID=A0A072TQN1_MEDTR|nr:amino acid transporter AVT1I isoform X1 [Medicago truncatula]KEH19717.1 transmembrane amino acid transporter family protein [Medicago truncatula]RHN41029.1 putative amino acid transporter, transmembrane domain-containing protein [Medicago truncatula]